MRYEFEEYIEKPVIIDSKNILKAAILEDYKEVQNPFGIESGNRGDYLIEDIDKILYIIKKEVFEKKYEKRK